jgi:hypothetical protein
VLHLHKSKEGGQTGIQRKLEIKWERTDRRSEKVRRTDRRTRKVRKKNSQVYKEVREEDRHKDNRKFDIGLQEEEEEEEEETTFHVHTHTHTHKRERAY